MEKEAIQKIRQMAFGTDPEMRKLANQLFIELKPTYADYVELVKGVVMTGGMRPHSSEREFFQVWWNNVGTPHPDDIYNKNKTRQI